MESVANIFVSFEQSKKLVTVNVFFFSYFYNFMLTTYVIPGEMHEGKKEEIHVMPYEIYLPYFYRKLSL